MEQSSIERTVTTRRFRLSSLYVGMFIVAFAFIFSYMLTIPAEDAVILFDYSKNLATRGVITYGYDNTSHIEGATDFLYMVLIAAISKFGASEVAAASALNYVGVLLILYLFLRRLKSSLSVLLVAILATPYLYASLLGFSAITFSASYVLCLYLVLSGDRRLYLAVLGMCLIRPDGVVWSVGLLLMRFIGLDRRIWLEEARSAFAYLIFPGVAYFAWRLWYFGEWLPLPFIVKASGNHRLDLTVDAIFPVVVPTVAAILCSKQNRQLTKQVSLLFLVPILFYSYMRLEQNIGNRFLAPMFFGVLMLLVIRKEGHVVTTFLFLSACLGYAPLADALWKLSHSRAENARTIALKLEQLPRGKLLSSEAGKLAYYSGWLADDSWGLNTPRFAHRLIAKSDISSGRYDVIVAHCDLEMLLTRRSDTVNSSDTRTWLNQCRSITGFLNESNYHVFFVPVYSTQLETPADGTGSACAVYLIYAISPSYSASARVKEILLDTNGIQLGDVSRGFHVSDDSVCSRH